ncbi:MAG TPA: hypothetical protein VFG21_05625 [Xanthomonadaceae bacterium]|nr:hypothetical protein [Xanthomonadaceae bacterium]
MHARTIFAVALVSGLCGCQRTLLQQAPAQAGCDARLVGLWLSVDESGRTGEMRARVGEDCTLDLDEEQADSRRSHPQTRLATAELGSSTILWVDGAWGSQTQSVDATVLDAAGSVYVFEYAVEADALTLWPPDHVHIAHAIIDGDIEGATLKVDSDLVSRLDGDPAELREALQRSGLFDRGQPLRFQREAGDP